MANIQIIQGDFEKKLHDLLERLWGREVPKTVGLFPPFHTDCGKNTIVGETGLHQHGL